MTAAHLSELRQRVALLERGGRATVPVLPFGVPALDDALPGGGLARGALHEICGRGGAAEEAAEPAAFLAGILARLVPRRPVLWCLGRADLYAPGLGRFGLAPERLILARVRNEAELLWAMEEGLRSRALAAVVGEVETLPGTAGRRLQLAAEASGIAAFALRRRRCAAPEAADAQPTAAMTRWRIAALPSHLADEPGIGEMLWSVELLRCRGGVPRHWIMAACDATGRLNPRDDSHPAAFTPTPTLPLQGGGRRSSVPSPLEGEGQGGGTAAA
jgi:protein ImuA